MSDMTTTERAALFGICAMGFVLGLTIGSGPSKPPESKPEAHAKAEDRPAFCHYCEGFGEVEIVQSSLENGKHVETVRREDCPICKGSGVERKIVGQRRRIDVVPVISVGAK